MSPRRGLTFWIVTLVVFCFLVWLLREILLPFVAGLALAYLQTPLADRRERHGLNHTVAALLIVGGVVLILVLLAVLLAPILLQQGASLLATIPDFVVGLLIAVPLAAAIGVVFRFGLGRYFESPYYQGEESG